MTKIDINLNLGYGRLVQRQPFLIATDTPVVLAFHSDYALKDCIVKFTSDTEKTCSFRLQNLSEIEIPQAFVHAGTVTVEVALIVKEQVVKRWSVEPIVLMEDTTGYALMPEFEDILSRLKAVEEFSTGIMSNVYELATIQATHSENIRDLYNSIEQ